MREYKNKISLFSLVLLHFLVALSFGQASEDASEDPNTVIVPRRGFPDLIPYLESKNEIISMHIATIQNPQQGIEEMPRVDEVREEWPNVTEGDELFDITTWFPLDEMRSDQSSDADEKRWVYYNKTNGYIVANADHFLQSSIYNFVEEKLLKCGFVNRLSVHWLEVDTEVDLNAEAIEKAGYKTLMKFSNDTKEQEVISFQNIDQNHEFTVDFGKGGTAWVRLYMYGESFETQIDLHLKRNVERIYNYGVAPSGKRSLLIVSVELVNLLDETLHFPINEKNYNRFDLLHDYKEDSSDKSDLKHYKVYSALIDTAELLGGFEEVADRDPFGDYQLLEKYQGDVIDISELFLKIGVVDVKAILDKISRTLFVYGNAKTHDQVVDVFDGILWRNIGVGYESQIELYEVSKDRGSALQKISVSNIDKKAKYLANIGSLSQAGARCRISQNGSECKVECIYGDKINSVDVSLAFDLKLPELVLENKLSLGAFLDEEKLMKIATNKNGKEIWMKFKVSKSVDDD